MNALSETFWAAIFVTIFGALISAAYVSKFRRLQRWAESEGSQIVSKSLRRSGDFYVTVEDREKRRFTGQVNVGGIVAALASKKPEATWDSRVTMAPGKKPNQSQASVKSCWRADL